MKFALLAVLTVTTSVSALEFKATTATSKVEGRARSNDQVLMLEAPHLYAIADGMEGHASAADAATLAIETLRTNFARPSAKELVRAVTEANRVVHAAAQADPAKKGMGATLVAMWLEGSRAHVVHAGDLRAWRFRDGKLTQLTKDHSLLNDYLKTRQLTPEEIRDFPMRNVVVRAIGVRKDVEPELTEVDLLAGDLLLLTSSGVQRTFEPEALEKLLSVPAPEAKTLVSAPRYPNYELSVILVRVSGK